MKVFVLAILVGVAFSSCKKVPFVDYTYTIAVRNESSSKIASYLAYGGWAYGDGGYHRPNEEGDHHHPVYPDTLLPDVRPDLNIIAPQMVFNYNREEKWSNLIDEVPSDTISLYIIDAEVYEDSAWSSIQTQHLYLRRYDIAASDANEYLEIAYDGE